MTLHTSPDTLPGNWHASRALPPCDGVYNRWIVIHPSNNDFTPFVVHTAHWNDEQYEWAYEYGDYCRNMAEAEKAFATRVFRYLGT